MLTFNNAYIYILYICKSLLFLSFPGAGINASNLRCLLECGVTEFHGTASECINSLMEYRHPDICFSSQKDNEYVIKQTSLEKVQTLVEIFNSFNVIVKEDNIKN